VIINRHNYEEFFLLYVDNELPPEDRRAVEEFLQQNADLAEELEMLKQAILPNDNIAFGAKEVLYKKGEGISLQNYEEYFLLSVDKELNPQQQQEVEKFVLKHPELQSEFTLLAKTRLEPEIIKFEGKEILFKNEEKEKPVVFLNWRKMSIAAAMIGVIAMGWFFTKNYNTSTTELVTVTHEKTNPLKEIAELPKFQKSAIEKDALVVTKKASLTKDASTTKKIKFLKEVEQKRSEGLLVANKKMDYVEPTTDKSSKNLKVTEDIQSRKTFEELIASAKIENNQITNTIKDEPKQSSFLSNNNNHNASEAIPAVYKELDTRENDEDNTFYLGSAEINKNKLKGLFKRAAGFFEKKNNYNDGEKTLKIAGFEIKSK
jgi:hypothetical protein